MLTPSNTRRAVCLLAATVGVRLISPQSSAEATCRSVTGHYREHDDGGPDCTSPDGAIVDIQTIVGGTDGFSGASGALRAEGTFTQAAGGESSYHGTVCLA